MSQALVTLGPWGGKGGSEWSYMLSGGLKRIIVHYGTCIYSIMFQDSTDKYSLMFGTKGGHRFENVPIDWPYEYLVSFSGRYGPYDRIESTVKYLLLETNVRSYPFGYSEEDDTFFSIPVKSGKFVGFHGRCSHLLDSIGLHLAGSTTPAGELACGTENTEIISKHVNVQRSADQQLLSHYVSKGPWGGPGGDRWSYVFVGQLKRIIIDYENRIRSIMFEDSSGYSDIFGTTAGSQIAEVQLESPNEFLTCLRGSYGKIIGGVKPVVKSLIIQTNLRTHGPFGTQNQNDPNEVEFRSPIFTSGRVVGFQGRCGASLDSIGLLVTRHQP